MSAFVKEMLWYMCCPPLVVYDGVDHVLSAITMTPVDKGTCSKEFCTIVPERNNVKRCVLLRLI